MQKDTCRYYDDVFTSKDQDMLLRMVERQKWFHRWEVVPGVWSNGMVDANLQWEKLEMAKMFESFEGKSVLDVGCASGFFSFAAERLGASRVVATDVVAKHVSGFEVASKLIGSNVEFIKGSVYDITPETFGKFDIVFFLGCLYHLRHPLLALDRLHNVCKEVMVVETHTCDKELNGKFGHRPLMRFYPRDELGHNVTNWWGPNKLCVEEMLTSARFKYKLIGQWGVRVGYWAYPQDIEANWAVQMS